MIVLTRKINVDTNAATDETYVSVINITPKVQQHAAEVYMTSGTVTLAPGTNMNASTDQANLSYGLGVQYDLEILPVSPSLTDVLASVLR